MRRFQRPQNAIVLHLESGFAKQLRKRRRRIEQSSCQISPGLIQSGASKRYHLPFIESQITALTGLQSLAEFQSLKIVHRLLMSPIESIITSLGTAHATNKPLMLFIFDEAVNLDLNSRNSNCFVFTALRRLLHVFYSLPLWTIFLSTNSRVGRFASPRRDDSSDRVSQGDLQRFPPFFAFPLDNEAKRRWSDPVLRTTEQAKPVSRFADVDHITMYGRPLWSAYSGQSRARVGAFVEHKLLCGRLDQARTTKRVNQFFALMAARVCLDPVMGQAEAMQLASEAVNSHLRYMVAWDDSIGLLSTVTPDEPIVADAAAAVLMKGGQQVGYIWSDCIQTVASELLSRGLVEKGLKGELYARLMCVLAVDFARHGNVRPDDVQFSYSTTVPTLLFLTRLIGDENFKQLATEPWLTHPRRALRKAATPHNPSPTDPPTLKSLYAEACLTLTHFTFTTSKLPKSPQNTILIVSNLLRRNAGLQLAPYQEHWDLLIPCYLGRPHEPFNIQAVSAILIQVKNTIKPNGKRYFVGEKEVQEYFPTDRPILQILMDLGTGTNSGAVADLATARLGSATGNVRTIIIEGSTARSFGFLAAHIGGKRLEEACQLLMGCLNTQLDQTVHDQILKKVVAGVNCETLLEQL